MSRKLRTQDYCSLLEAGNRVTDVAVSTNDLLSRWLSRVASGSPMVTAWITLEQADLDRAGATRQIAELHGVCEGWLRTMSWAGVTPIDALPDDAGPPLRAEGALAPDQSFALSLQAPNRWLFTRITEHCSQVEGGIPVLAQDVTHVAGGQLPGQDPSHEHCLVYRVYWAAPADDPTAIARIGQRFIGFSTTAAREKSE